MKLHTLSKTVGSTHRRRRVGCGIGSGHGKTSGRGNKGMKARSGGGVRPGYEGGQMPLYRRFPQRGFSNYKFRTTYALINVGDLGKITGAEVDACLPQDSDVGEALGDGASLVVGAAVHHQARAGSTAGGCGVSHGLSSIRAVLPLGSSSAVPPALEADCER